MCPLTTGQLLYLPLLDPDLVLVIILSLLSFLHGGSKLREKFLFSHCPVFCPFSNPSPRISRSVSTSSPAEINGSVTAKTAVNSVVCLLTTNVGRNNGTVITIWN